MKFFTLSSVFACCSLACVLDANAATQIVAHRGNSQAAPENAIASIYAAVGYAELSEMDVRVTADGELVLMHNATINKTTHGRGPVARKTLDELQTLDAGSWFSNDFTDQRVPTLSEAIDTSFSLRIDPTIERKSGSAQLFHSVFTRVNLERSDFRVISFNQRFIRDLNPLNPDYPLGILGGGGLPPARLRRLANADADFLSWHHGSIRRQPTVDLVHTSGMELYVWTVNQPRPMEDLMELGVDGITTDNPHLLSELRQPDMPPVAAASGSAVMVPEPSGKTSALLALMCLWSAGTTRRRSR